jgi:hypothetical protein
MTMEREGLMSFKNDKGARGASAPRTEALALEDNVYFTLRDIFLNTNQGYFITQANQYNSRLTNNIRYEDRTPIFQYTNDLKYKVFVKSIYNWLNSINELFDFNFDEDFDSEFDKNTEELRYNDFGNISIIYKNKFNYEVKYITLDAWWEHLKELKALLNTQIEKS